jgi:protein-S-isoprenylcysteine O-methyltransferase Ste14
MKLRGVPITTLFALAAAFATTQTVQDTRLALADTSWHTWAVAAHDVLQVATLVLFGLLTVVRPAPIRRTRNPRAFVVCAVAVISVGVLRKPPETASTAVVLASDAIAICFSAWLVVAVTRLGRCFGVLPDVRGLRRNGPYAVVRHPVYLGEIGVCLGLVIAAPTLWNLIIATAFVLSQASRMSLEERALTDAFPEYAAYAAVTPRVIPFAKLGIRAAHPASTTADNA